MKFEAVPLEEAEDQILGHNITGGSGRRVLRKGRPLGTDDIAKLRALGRTSVYVARLEQGDLPEDEAAGRISLALAAPGCRLSAARTGRVNFYAEQPGVLRLELGRLVALNSLPGVTLATLPERSGVAAGKMVATLKVIPYALGKEVVETAEEIAARPAPLVTLSPMVLHRVGLILSGAAGAQERIVSSFRNALAPRLSALGATLQEPVFLPLEEEGAEEQLAMAIQGERDRGIEVLLLAGDTAIMDRFDIAPRAVELAGGTVSSFGAPVDPGNLLLVGYLKCGLPVVGAPGCARSPKRNVIDLVLPRILTGECLGPKEIAALGHGGLLEDVPERPAPRSRLG
ncbi:MAG: molybdopterin-binding protein [Deltaproteobacteria bacterium]|nr:molybdopterin-binding protein [Deltaproteobacteria bacterium]